MAKGRYQKWLESENLVLLEGWKRNGLTDKQIAENMGISVNTLDKWKQRFVQIRQALKIGHESANYAVERKLFQKAMKGNTTAMIFWLKNNWRDKYNDSALSPEEREMIKARKESVIQDTRIKKLRADAIERLETSENDAGDKTVLIDDIGGIDDGDDKA
ncbi:helix-turn-helix domain-containing protein [Limosilactobacillus mucosae]|uniref:Helix-turn-helix domain-containing protein n=1 Tax=Limosilactobacillus mucosae TaxID=97478 RepID=A0AAJ1MCE3_LIMMU|nr:helix-turn-helix domain-containing protein [Limosilactobacillus mucosae]MDC2827668.1 helix-turn-helix domain-containing protein [Limosilactobacillus mucosae]MDC2830413.1 helix-turn-helix domain-containing protein [Limosilactobacillus mucosae]MDC2835335.1 helix-turn-helix domain-containing protein [Limosilactobacillus mucosae]MDC2837987.1 helix-turn-helix domain-containing protein [Limosilactobacillus mucosae]MDC2850000.1 helix-turn-helix domain-containing protein [Limosilactobacillus mucosa